MAKNPHDRLFKLALRQLDNARCYVRSVLPAELVAQLDLEQLESEPTDLVSEKLRERFSDLVYKIPFGDRSAYMGLLLEHQSTSDLLMPFRFLEASVSIWRDLLHDEPGRRKLPMLISVLVENGKGPSTAPATMTDLYDASPDQVALLQPYLPQLRYIVDDLHTQSEEEIDARAPELYLRLVLLSLRARGEVPPPDRLPAWVESFRALWRAGNEAAIEALLRYHVGVSGEDSSTIVDAAIAAHPGIEEKYVTLYDKILREGEAKGRAEGRVQGEVTVLEKLLRLKFGDLPADVRTRLHQATTDDLERWAERILFADSLAGVFDPPA